MMAAVSITPLPSAFATTTFPALTASTRPATPRNESPRSSRGSQKLSSTRRRITSTGCRPSTVFRKTRRSRTVRSAPSARVKPEISRQIGMLEVSLVERSRGQQDGARMIGIAPGPAATSRWVRKKDARRLTFDSAKRIRQNVRHDRSIFERITRSRRRLRAVGEHPPAAVGRARQVHAEQMQMGMLRERLSRSMAAEKPDSRTASAAGMSPL